MSIMAARRPTVHAGTGLSVRRLQGLVMHRMALVAHLKVDVAALMINVVH
jgi:hypothetical protein